MSNIENANMTINNEGKLAYMTYFRGFAIIMIVFVHCVTRFLDHEDVTYYYVHALFVHSTNLFLFISGFLFEYLQYKKYPYGAFIRKKYHRLIVPYLFWALPVSILLMLTVQRDRGLEYLAWTMWTGLDHYNNAHWYITFIFLVFIIAPLIRKYLSYRGVLYTVFLPFFLFLTLISGRANVGWFYGQMTFFSLIGMFFLGMFFARHRTTLVHKMYTFDWFFLILGFFISAYQGYCRFEDAPYFEAAMCDLMRGSITINMGAANKILFAIGFLLLFYRISLRNNKIIVLEKLAHYSFAIYFVHLYVALGILFFMRFIGISAKGGFFHFLVLSFIVLILSSVIIYALRQMKLTKGIVGV